MRRNNSLVVYLLAFVFALSLAWVSNAQDKNEKKKNDKIELSNKKQTDDATNSYQTLAKKHSLDLMKKVNLTLDQTTEIRDILVEYQRDIEDEFRNKLENGYTFDDEGNLTGSVRNDENEIAENADVEKENIDKDYREIDKNANESIEDVIGEENINEYVNVKKDWWNKIKAHVFSMPVQSEEMTDTEVAVNDENIDTEEAETRNQEDETNLMGSNENVKSDYDQFAKQMATELMDKIDLSLQQAADVKQALIEYQKNIVEERRRIQEKKSEIEQDTENVAANTENEMEETEREGESELVGSGQLDLSKVDKSANEDIRSVLTETQQPKYEQVKDSWWKDVKDQAYTNVRNNIQHERKMENKD